ncbi:MAG: hypothetical protein ACREQ9_15860 [Candidatus Binatia bacterium]
MSQGIDVERRTVRHDRERQTGTRHADERFGRARTIAGELE